MRLRTFRRFIALSLASIALTAVSPDAQDTDYVGRMKKLNLPTLPGNVPAYYVTGHRERAEMLQRRLDECNAFFEQRLGVRADVTLAVLDAAGWKAVTGESYGLPQVGGTPAVVLMPATSGSPAFQLMVARRNAIPPDLLKAFLAQRGTTFEGTADQFVDLIGFHELGHVLTMRYGIDPTNRWMSEFLASYWMHAYISERQPEWKAVFDLMGRPSAERPKNTSLEDFERLYGRVDDYGWYQGHFETRIREIYPTQFLQRLEKIAPGSRAWGETFSPAPAGR